MRKYKTQVIIGRMRMENISPLIPSYKVATPRGIPLRKR